MKKLNYLHYLLLIGLLFNSCTNDSSEIEEETTIGELTNFNIDNNNIFIDNEANLIINAKDYSLIQVSSTNTTDVTIRKIDDLNYKISSSQVGSELIYMTVIDNKGNKLEASRRLYFYEHGTNDYNTVEGIIIDTDTTSKILSLHGEPEGTFSYTSTGDNPIAYENWYYFSKGLYFTTIKSNGVISSMSLFGASWAINIDDTIHTGSYYSYNFDGLGKLNSSEGITMDSVVEKYGEPDSKNISSSATSTLKWYTYNDLNSEVPSTQYGIFYFYSDDIEDYKDKKVTRIRLN